VDLEEPPGRDLLVSDRHTFADLARTIDAAFARWDLGHLHEFVLPDGRRLTSEPEDPDEVADDAITLGGIELRKGASFTYLFDIGAGWEHDCSVMRADVDPEEELGVTPAAVVPLFGWGTIPDQYGRTEPDAE
jgi:hypothetical protein